MLSANHQLGRLGEDAAADFLTGKGYELVRRNYRHRRAEVDIIVRLGTRLLVFVEVKARSSSQFGNPEEFVTERKRQLFRQAAEQLQEEIDWRGDIRFDVLALTPLSQGFRIEHFEDAFF